MVMPNFSDDRLLSCDGKTELRVRSCYPPGVTKGVVQIAHGICEHIERYDEFAAYLAYHGYLVVGNDHLGHGKSAATPEDLGFFGETAGWELAVRDMRGVYEHLRESYPRLPYFLFGHSMGSFLTRTYLIKYRDGLSGAILSGTGQQREAVLTAGVAMARQEIHRNGPRYRSKRLNNMAFGSYNRHMPKPLHSSSDWLTRDLEVLARSAGDPLTEFIPTASLFADMLGGMAYNQKAGNLRRMNKALPVLFLSGDMDPVGDEGKGVWLAYRSFLDAGMEDVTLRLYPGGRHEMINETNRQQVYRDVLDWYNIHLK